MTEASLATASQPSGASTKSYQSLAELRDAHLALRESISKLLQQTDPPDVNEQIRSFLDQARQSGAFIADPRERRAAQAILDYWSAELASSPRARIDDFKIVLLDKPDPNRSRADSAPVSPVNKADQRALIRLVALARQYAEADELKRSGYLLTEDALEQAKRFKDQDPTLAKFVEASEDVIRRRSRNRRNFWLVTCVILGSFLGTVLWAYYFSWLASAIQTRIAEVLVRTG